MSTHLVVEAAGSSGVETAGQSNAEPVLQWQEGRVD
jgi:hypothetical protein